ncbi:type IV conjugative transfer system lipoprotein TraV [Halomonas sp. DP5N14-9]|uniref:type IV conjugative transfer system lipoprotein TraV n=1 Tax=Halomonas sp. DP5N14-9 TaxID=2859075 RepID=UPI001C9981CD|nr:type IV conjugative transfer system lipoprotein TraV [Halomonas sp. DP5N14-9]MBY5940575.1 type IV conjugative transfer system lipoprotein TraV [Halomonas sp. DP5N14-9]
MTRSISSLLKLIVSLGIGTVISGCSALNIGESEYSCSGIPEGVRCMSTKDVYNLTNNGNVPVALGAESVESATRVAGDQPSAGGEDPNDVVGNYVSPRLPDRPVPVRTPAEVMRIWIAPWEDDDGDLIVTGHLYTEIEPRRWVIGEPTANTQPSLKPLQSIQRNDEAE